MKTVCAALIVKNESKVIERCLNSIKDFIDYWVICDTGSTDDTKSIINSELSGISGELHEVEWVSFGHNRTELLKLCKGKADYLLLIDADEILLVHDKHFKNQLVLDSYLIRFEGDLEWRQKKLISNSIDWRYVGVTHEYITSDQDNAHDAVDFITLNHFCDGSRRPAKFKDDIRLLESALQEDPENERYWFYLAQSYFDLGEIDKALNAYQKRIDLGGWDQEVYYSAFKKALCLKELQEDFPTEEFLQAHEFRPSRSEAMYEVIKFFRENNFFDTAYVLAKKEIEKPKSQDILFIDRSIRDYRLKDELAVCSYWVGEYEESLRLNEELLENPLISKIDKKRITENKEFAENKIQEKV